MWFLKIKIVDHNLTNKNTMKRKYQKPAMNVVLLKAQVNLLTTSGVKSTRSGYGDAEEYYWEE